MVTLMLIDKGYYDYDFEKVEKNITFESTVKSEAEVNDMVSRFGFGTNKKKKPKDMNAEELQAHAMKQNN